MVIREWRGRASPSRVDGYPKHFRDHVVPALRQVPGFVGAYLSSRSLGDKIEVLVLTQWRSMDDIRTFAGNDVDKAVVEPGAVAVLLDFESRVHHYDIIEDVQP